MAEQNKTSRQYTLSKSLYPSDRTTLTIDAVVYDTNIAMDLQRELLNVQGIRRTTYLRDNYGIPHIQVSLTDAAMPFVRDILVKFADKMSESHSRWSRS